MSKSGEMLSMFVGFTVVFTLIYLTGAANMKQRMNAEIAQLKLAIAQYQQGESK